MEYLSNAQLAALLVDTFALPDGIMYRVTGHPRYALRDLRFSRVIPPDPRAFPATKAVSGPILLQTTAWVAERARTHEQMQSPGHPPTDVGGLSGDRTDPASRDVTGVPPLPATTGPLYAEWDLVNGTAATLTDEDTVVTNTATVDLRVVMGNDGYFDISAGAATSTDDNAIPVVDRAAYRHRFGTTDPRRGVTALTVGRFPFTDAAENVFTGTVDGLGVVRTGPRLVFDGAVASTALLPARRFDRGVTRRDLAYLEDDHLLAPPRYLVAAGITAPEIAGRQTFGVQALAQIDDDSLRALESGQLQEGRDALDTGYLSLVATGPTGLRSFYTVTLTAAGGRYRSRYADGEGRTITAGATTINWRWYRPEALGSRFGVTVLAATGDTNSASYLDADGDSTYAGYVAPAVTTRWRAFRGGLSNAVAGEVRYSVKPIDSIVLGLSSIALGRGTTQPIAGEPGIDPDSSNRYLGTEVGFEVGIQPSAEVKVELNSSIFYPAPVGTGIGAYSSEENPRWLVGVDARIRL